MNEGRRIEQDIKEFLAKSGEEQRAKSEQQRQALAKAKRADIGSLRGTKSLFRKNLPLPLSKGKGIKGIGFK